MNHVIIPADLEHGRIGAVALRGAVYVLPVSVPLDLTAELTCDYRPAAPW